MKCFGECQTEQKQFQTKNRNIEYQERILSNSKIDGTSMFKHKKRVDTGRNYQEQSTQEQEMFIHKKRNNDYEENIQKEIEK